MPSLSKVALFTVPLLAFGGQWFAKQSRFLGLFKTVEGYNNHNCKVVEGESA